MLHEVVYDERKIPFEAVPCFRKSKILLFEISFSLFSLPAVPSEKMALTGLLALVLLVMLFLVMPFVS